MTTFTLVHVVISLLGIGSGLVVAWGLLLGKNWERWTAFFLTTTVATSVTGFLFPFHGLKPSHILGILSLIVLALAIVARYRRHLVGSWRLTYVISAMTALYFNVFVLIVQSFTKVPGLHMLAPTQMEPPFKFTQLAVLLFFVVVTVVAAKKYRVA